MMRVKVKVRERVRVRVEVAWEGEGESKAGGVDKGLHPSFPVLHNPSASQPRR